MRVEGIRFRRMAAHSLATLYANELKNPAAAAAVRREYLRFSMADAAQHRALCSEAVERSAHDAAAEHAANEAEDESSDDGTDVSDDGNDDGYAAVDQVRAVFACW